MPKVMRADFLIQRMGDDLIAVERRTHSNIPFALHVCPEQPYLLLGHHAAVSIGEDQIVVAFALIF